MGSVGGLVHLGGSYVTSSNQLGTQWQFNETLELVNTMFWNNPLAQVQLGYNQEGYVAEANQKLLGSGSNICSSIFSGYLWIVRDPIHKHL